MSISVFPMVSHTLNFVYIWYGFVCPTHTMCIHELNQRVRRRRCDSLNRYTEVVQNENFFAK